MSAVLLVGGLCVEMSANTQVAASSGQIVDTETIQQAVSAAAPVTAACDNDLVLVGDNREGADRFGGAVGRGDFNGDGFDDLATSAPSENARLGMVHVVYGSRRGLLGRTAQIFGPDDLPPPPPSTSYSGVGEQLAAGDVNGDRLADLVVSVVRFDDVTGDLTHLVVVLFGSAAGLSPDRSQVVSEEQLNPTGSSDQTSFGETLALGRFDADRYADLAIGAPSQDVPRGDGTTVFDAGAVYVLHGSATGLTTTDVQLWSQNAPGVPEQAGREERFGSVLTVGQFNSDRRSDLVVAVPSESVSGPGGTTVVEAGVVHILYGGDHGLTTVGTQLWHLGRPGVPGSAFAARWGMALAAANFGHGRQDDLAVGAPFDEYVGGMGTVTLLFSSPDGLTSAAAQRWTQDTPGLQDQDEGFDHFGWTLAAGDLGHQPQADLAIGVNGEVIGRRPDPDDHSGNHDGAVNVIYGTPAGLSTTDNRFLSHASPCVPGAPQQGSFGATLTAGRFGRSPYADLAVGAPSHFLESGTVTVLYGKSAGVAGKGSQLLRQGSNTPQP